MPKFPRFPSYLGRFAPGGTPRHIIDWLNVEANQALRHPPMRERFDKLRLQIVDGTPTAGGGNGSPQADSAAWGFLK